MPLLWFVVVLAATASQAQSKVNPELLKPCFERYDGHKLFDAQPFHSEWKMRLEEDCLAFCASASSRCQSIVYDRYGHICHYFMVDGIEQRKVIPARGMAYFQLADTPCAEQAMRTAIETDSLVPPLSEEQNVPTLDDGVPVVFAPERFPQPPTTSDAPPTTSTLQTEMESKEPQGDVGEFDFAKEETPFNPPRKFQKFDDKTPKLEKTQKEAIETTISDDDDDARPTQMPNHTYRPMAPSVPEPKVEELLSDVRVPQQSETEHTLEDVEYREPSEVLAKQGGTEYDDEVHTQEPPLSSPSTTSPSTSTEFVSETEAPVTERDLPTFTTEAASVNEEQMETEPLEQETTEPPAEKTNAEMPLVSSFNPRFQLPKERPSFSIDMASKMLPEMKGFKVAKKEFVMPDIRRHPVKNHIRTQSMHTKESGENAKPLVAAFAASINKPSSEEASETGELVIDEECPGDANRIWIAVENSDLPRIGKFISREAKKPDDCIRICQKLLIENKPCNSFVFYETTHRCSFGHEEGIFGVKPARAADFSTRAYKRLCYPASLSPFNDCGDFLAFRDYKLLMEPKETFDGLPVGREGVSACVELCVLSTSFHCKSSTFDFATGTCSLFGEHSLSAAGNFKEHRSDSILYFENGCGLESSNNVDLHEASVEKVDHVDSEDAKAPVRLDFRKLRA